MHRFFMLLAVLVCFGLAGCENTEENIKDAIRAKLRDPASATFSDFVDPRKLEQDVSKRRFPRVMYVQVNAKNSFGGYTGKQEWVAFLDSKGKVEEIGPVVGPTDDMRAELHRLCDDGNVMSILFAERLASLGDLSCLEIIEAKMEAMTTKDTAQK